MAGNKHQKSHPRHPDLCAETKCAVCGVSIPSECAKAMPKGTICPTCATRIDARTASLSLGQTIAVTLIGLGSGAIAGWAVEFQVGFFLTPLLAVVFGALIAESVVRILRPSYSIRLCVLLCFSLAAGALGARIGAASYLLLTGSYTCPPLGPFYVVADLVYPSPIPGIALACVILGAFGRIRQSERRDRGKPC